MEVVLRPLDAVEEDEEEVMTMGVWTDDPLAGVTLLNALESVFHFDLGWSAGLNELRG